MRIAALVFVALGVIVTAYGLIGWIVQDGLVVVLRIDPWPFELMGISLSLVALALAQLTRSSR